MSTRGPVPWEALLDDCIDRLVDGRPWDDLLTGDNRQRAEVNGLMNVATLVLAFARGVSGPPARARKAVWERVKNRRSLLRTIAFYRLPYLPPLWLKPEAS